MKHVWLIKTSGDNRDRIWDDPSPFLNIIGYTNTIAEALYIANCYIYKWNPTNPKFFIYEKNAKIYRYSDLTVEKILLTKIIEKDKLLLKKIQIATLKKKLKEKKPKKTAEKILSETYSNIIKNYYS
jgi:hypothetical protein